MQSRSIGDKSKFYLRKSLFFLQLWSRNLMDTKSKFLCPHPLQFVISLHTLFACLISEEKSIITVTLISLQVRFFPSVYFKGSLWLWFSEVELWYTRVLIIWYSSCLNSEILDLWFDACRIKIFSPYYFIFYLFIFALTTLNIFYLSLFLSSFGSPFTQMLYLL